MGCFLACFGSTKNNDRKRRRKQKVLPGHQKQGSFEPPKPTPSLNQESKEIPINDVSEHRVKPEEQLSLSARKKVTFDLNVKSYEHVPAPEFTNYSSENDQEKERGKEEEKTAKTRKSLSLSDDNSVTLSLGSSPPNYRYQNCGDGIEEDGGIKSDESDLDDDDEYDGDSGDEDVEPTENKEESSESFFSLPMGSRTHKFETPPNEKEVNSSMQVCGSPERELKTLPLNQNARDRSNYVHSVLNPVENLSQWKTVKARPRATTPPSKNQKENTNFEQEPQISFSPEPTFKLSPLKSNQNLSHSKPTKQEIAVDASLSNWLVSTETTPHSQTSSFTFTTESADGRSQRSNSPRSLEDRPILGALTVEELKQLSASSSPRRRSPSRSPDEIPILGTVGSYWSHTGQAMDSSSGSSCKGIPNTTSKYREDKKVNWHSTPFERRLERALNRGSAEAYSSKV